MSLPVLESQSLRRPRRPGVSVREVRCTILLHALAHGDSTGYTANLYKGCTHGCVYCYAPSLTRDERRGELRRREGERAGGPQKGAQEA